MEESDDNKQRQSRPYIGVQFQCCQVYTRIYRDPKVMYYEGRCPKCMKPIRVEVDPKNGVAGKFIKAE